MKVFPSYAANPEKGQFLFVLLSQPFYKAQLVPVMTISILRSSLGQPFYQALLVPMTTISILGNLARLDGAIMFVSRCSSEKSEMGVSV